MRDHNRALRDEYQKTFCPKQPHFWRKLFIRRQVLFELMLLSFPWNQTSIQSPLRRVSIQYFAQWCFLYLEGRSSLSRAMRADLSLDDNENYFLNFLRLSIVIWLHGTSSLIETVSAKWRILAYITIILNMDMAMPKRWVTLSVGCTSNS